MVCTVALVVMAPDVMEEKICVVVVEVGWVELLEVDEVLLVVVDDVDVCAEVVGRLVVVEVVLLVDVVLVVDWVVVVWVVPEMINDGESTLVCPLPVTTMLIG